MDDTALGADERKGDASGLVIISLSSDYYSEYRNFPSRPGNDNFSFWIIKAYRDPGTKWYIAKFGGAAFIQI